MVNIRVTCNSTYGASKDKNNALYDPLMANSVCLTGQLLLLDLIEKIENHCELIQSNTDGIYMLVKDMETVDIIKSIAKEWEQRTMYELEWDIYSKIYQRDVNNYIIIDDKGHYKSKGCVKKLNPIDYDLPIITKSIIEYCVNGTSIEDTINSCNDLIEFQKVVKVSSLYKYAMYGDEQLKEKVLRVFASSDENAKGVFKVKNENRIEKIANTPAKCFINNENIIGVKIPSYLDKQYYIDLANDMLIDFLGSNDANVKNKEETIESKLITILNKNYDTMYEVLKDMKENTSITTTQLIKYINIDVFKRYGKVNKILEYLNYFKLLHDKKSTKDVTLTKNNVPTSIINIIKKYSNYNEEKGTYSKLDSEPILIELWNELSDIDVPIMVKLNQELELYDELSIIDTTISPEYLYIMHVNQTKNPTVIAYCINNGNINMLKVPKELFTILEIKEHDIINAIEYELKPCVKVLGKDASGINILGDDDVKKEWWLIKYDILERDYNKHKTLIIDDEQETLYE